MDGQTRGTAYAQRWSQLETATTSVLTRTRRRRARRGLESHRSASHRQIGSLQSGGYKLDGRAFATSSGRHHLTMPGLVSSSCET